MDLKQNESLLEMLAAQYALGTLRGGARRRFEALCLEDRAVAAKVARWNEHLAPLAELVPPVTPPARVWDGIVGRVPALQPAGKPKSGWFESVLVWRGLAAAMSVVAIVALAVAFGPLSSGGHEAAGEQMLATFAAPDTKQPLAVILMPEHGDRVLVKVVTPSLNVPKGQALQLWLISPGTTAMVSAGVLPDLDANGSAHLTLPNAQAFRGAKALGLSLEPAGGSPQPTHALGFAQWTHDAT